MSPEALLYLVVLVLYIVLRPLYTSLIRRVLSFTKTDVDDRLYSAVEGPLWLAILLFVLDMTVSAFLYNALIHGLLLSAAVILLAIALIRGGKILIEEVFGPARFVIGDEKTKRTVLSIISNLYVALVLFFAFIYVLGVWNVDVTPLIASAGLFGIVAGLALKDPLQNLISGILLLMDPPFRVGDVVKIGDRVGEVVEIGIRNTKILTFDGDLVVLPNSSILSTEVENYHLPTDAVRAIVRVGVSYDSDPEHVSSVLLDIARSHPLVLQEPEPQVYFLEMGDFALLFELRVWTKLSNRLRVISDLNMAIIKRFREEGIEIPYPITTVYLRSENLSITSVKGQKEHPTL